MGGATVTYECKTSEEAMEYINSQYKLAGEYNMLLDYACIEYKSGKAPVWIVSMRLRK